MPEARPSNPPDTTRAAEAPMGGAAAQPQLTDPPRRDQTPLQHFLTPHDHYSNPVDNMLEEATRLNALPLTDETPFAVEARNAIELLQTAVAQQEKDSYSRDRVQSTPLWSQSYSRHVESPAVSSSECVTALG